MVRAEPLRVPPPGKGGSADKAEQELSKGRSGFLKSQEGFIFFYYAS